MEKLLQWSTKAQQDPANAGEPDSKLLAQLFGAGPDDQGDMRRSLQTAVESTNLDGRIEGLERFEELIEKLDNANNMGKLWEPLLYLVNDRNPEIRAPALSAIGSAVQNNDKGQADLLATGSGIDTIMQHVCDSNGDVASKALYALTCALGHCPAAYDKFVDNNGWPLIKHLVSQINMSKPLTKPEKRVLSLLNTIALLEPKRPVVKQFEKSGIVPKLAELSADVDADGKEKLASIFAILKEHGVAVN